MSPDSLEPARAPNTTAGCRYAFFLTLLLVIVLTQVEVEKQFEITSPVAQLLTADPMPLSTVRSMNATLAWMQTQLPSVIANTCSTSQFSHIITPIRVVQKRMNLINNPSETFKDFIPKVWEKPIVDMFSSQDYEDRSSYGQHMTFTYLKAFGAAQEGGFGFALNPCVSEELSGQLKRVMHSGFVDQQTASLYLDFALYNGHYNYLVYVQVRFQGSSSGYVSSQSEILPLRPELYSNTGHYMRAVGEILYILMTLLYTCIEVYDLKVAIAAQAFQLRQESIKTKWLKTLKGALAEYFADTWNYVDFACLAISYVSISLWISILATSFDAAQGTVGDWDLLNKIYARAELCRVYKVINAINIFLAFIHLVKYLEVFKRIAILRESLQRASAEIAYFGALVTVVVLSYVIFAHLIFGTIEENFSTPANALMECILIVFRDYQSVQRIRALEPTMSQFFFITFTVLVVFIFLNMFIAILSAAYKSCLDELERRKKGKLKVHPIVKIRKKLKEMWRKLKAAFNKRNFTLSRLNPLTHSKDLTFGQPTELTEMAMVVTHARSSQSDFNSNFSHSQQFPEPSDADSARTKAQAIADAQRKIVVGLGKASGYVMFVALILSVLLWEQKIEDGNMINNTVLKALKSGETGWESVVEFEGVRKWLIASNNIFREDNDGVLWVASRMYLWGQENTPLRLSLRRVKMQDNDSNLFASYAPIVRISSGFDPESRGVHEDTSPISLRNSTILAYTNAKGYMNAGGFILNSHPFTFLTDMNEIADLFTDSLNSLVLDYALYSPNLNTFVHVAHVFRFKSGGQVSKWLQVTPVRLQYYATSEDQARAAVEVILIVCIVAMACGSAARLLGKWREYTAWRKDLYDSLSPELIKQRNRVKPEWLRRLKALFGLLTIFEIVAYLLAFIAMIIRVIFIVKSNNLNDILAAIGPLAQLQKDYFTVSSVSCFLFCIQLLHYFRLNYSLGVLQRTLAKASRDILYYLVLFVNFWTAFAFMAYLGFGVQLEHFASLEGSYLFCFQMMLRSYNYAELRTADSILAPVFFTVFMIFFVFVILNIFVVILERAYAFTRNAKTSKVDISLWKSLRKCLLNWRKQPKSSASKPPILLKDTSYQVLTVGSEPFTSVEQWANLCAEQIISEKLDRQRLCEDINVNSKCKSQKKRTQLIQSKVESSYRLKYWMYMRDAYQLQKQQEAQAISDKDKIVSKAREKEIEMERRTDSNRELIHRVAECEKEVERLDEELAKLERTNRYKG